MRIKRRLDLLQMRPAELARRVGLTRGAVAHWGTGGARGLALSHVHPVADALRCEARWLLTGTGPEEIPTPLRPAVLAMAGAANRLNELQVATLTFLATSLGAAAAVTAPELELLSDDERAVVAALRRCDAERRAQLVRVADIISGAPPDPIPAPQG